MGSKFFRIQKLIKLLEKDGLKGSKLKWIAIFALSPLCANVLWVAFIVSRTLITSDVIEKAIHAHLLRL